MNDERVLKTFTLANILEAGFTSTGRRGGDGGHGGRTEVWLEDGGCTDWSMEVEVGGEIYNLEEMTRVKLVVRGDCELQTLGEALKWLGEKCLAAAEWGE